MAKKAPEVVGLTGHQKLLARNLIQVHGKVSRSIANQILDGLKDDDIKSLCDNADSDKAASIITKAMPSEYQPKPVVVPSTLESGNKKK